MAHSVTVHDVLQKLRTIQPKPPGKTTVPTTAYQTDRVTALEDGLNLNRTDGGLIRYQDISMLFTFRLDADPDTWYVDLFVYQQPGAFRISQKVVTYRQFLTEVPQRSKDTFYAFVLHIISQTDSLYIDDHTVNFLKTRKIMSFPDFKLVEEYTRQLWHQIMTWMTFTCDQCGEIYWVDDAKIREQGAKTKCVKCQHVITVKKRQASPPFTETKEAQKEPCPHCQYENPKGAQFCVMCQNPLGEIKPRTVSPAPAPSKVLSSPIALESENLETASSQSLRQSSRQETASPEEPAVPPPEMSTLPLQAQGRRKPQLSFREIDDSLKDDIQTLHNPFAWFTKFSWIMQAVAYLFLFGGFLLGVYIYFVYPDPPLPEVFTKGERLTSAVISSVVGAIMFLASMITSNIIALMLQIERNTKITTILFQKLIEKDNV
jgi:predicted Zn finger-like uncharacterized protein